ncbi:hypothetical protein GCM10009854_20350 [Saccharopolyspora halophila]|uniref:O-methyltransferase C-terminal domain-containing protein n=1 Tax=Saccharopolyspora halophila TaxID=405551 RepID=A0ABN3G3Q2_9PSEU
MRTAVKLGTAENPRACELFNGELFNAGVAAFAPGADELFGSEYDFPAAGVAVDVGGGIGGVLLEALRQHPGLRGVLFDQPAVQEEHVLDELGEPGRWELATGDFFEMIPRGGDVHALRYGTHDWNDQQCVRILRNCREAAAGGGRILVVDTVLPAGNVTRMAVDVLMMLGLPGRERTEPGIERLFTEAGLRSTRIIPIGPTLSVLAGIIFFERVNSSVMTVLSRRG